MCSLLIVIDPETMEEAEHSFVVGNKDYDLMMRLTYGGPVEAKYRRMIAVYLDITAPLYWWKEFDTYKVGTVSNSCSTMHKIHEKKFVYEDFSHEKLLTSCGCLLTDPCYISTYAGDTYYTPFDIFDFIIDMLNRARELYLETRDKRYWHQMIQLLPSSYNQRRTVMVNYEVLVNIYKNRKNHKLDEWIDFCKWIEELPYSELITGKERSANDGVD